MIRVRSIPFALAALVALVVRPDETQACGMYVPPIVFVRSNGPDTSFERFLGGSVGLVDANYRTSDLAIAYRHFVGLGFDAAETAAVLESRASRDSRPYDDAREDTWFEARTRVVPGRADFSSRGFTTDDYEQIDNCGADAFATAARTLEARVRELGTTSPEVIRYVAAQDRVFLACARGDAPMVDAPPADATARERHDRTYQIAAQTFYMGRYADALRAFEAIASDGGSEWKDTARYLTARVHQRLSSDPGRREAELAASVAVLDGILADPAMSSWHVAASRYRDFVRARLDPTTRVRELSIAIASGHRGVELGPMLADLDTLDSPTRFVDVPESDRFGVFVEVLRTRNDESARLAATLHRSSRSPAFLVAALVAMTSAESLPRGEADELFEAARRLPPSDPAYVSAIAHRARLLLGRADVDRRAMRRALLDARESIADSRGASASHALTLLAFAYSDSVDEAVATAGAPVTVAEEHAFLDDLEPTVDLATRSFDFHAFGKRLLDRLPLDEWSRIARGSSLPASARDELATVGYVRALLTSNDSVRRALAPAVATRFAPLASEIRAVEAARTSGDRRYARIWLLLHAPGLRAELDEGARLAGDGFVSSATYYCPSAPAGDEEGPFANRLTSDLDSVATRIGGERRAPSRAAITALPPAGVFLAREAIAAVAARPDDPRNAELLSRAVRATRWSCPGPGTRAASRDAFRLLHRRYGSSEAAGSTPYYFGDP